MNLTRRWFLFTVVFAFAAFMLLINTNSAHADKHKLNTHYLVVGIALALVAAFGLSKVVKYGGTKGSDRGQ